MHPLTDYQGTSLLEMIQEKPPVSMTLYSFITVLWLYPETKFCWMTQLQGSLSLMCLKQTETWRPSLDRNLDPLEGLHLPACPSTLTCDEDVVYVPKHKLLPGIKQVQEKTMSASMFCFKCTSSKVKNVTQVLNHTQWVPVCTQSEGSPSERQNPLLDHPHLCVLSDICSN